MKRVQLTLLLTIIMLLNACSSPAADVPSDFYMLMDVHDADHQTAKNINIRIHASGKVEYDIYETGGVIRYDENDIVSYDKSQIVQHGKFRLAPAEMESLWASINSNGFFELPDDYRMQMGHSYAFMLIEANGTKHMVDNIGMEVPEIRALVETVAAVMPADIKIEYGKGYIP